MARSLRDTRMLARRPAQAKTLRPANVGQLMRCMDPLRNVAVPIRARGSGSSSTDCNLSQAGTTIDMTGLSRIVHVDTYNHVVTVEAGARIGALIAALAEHGLELEGSFENTERTVGGALASPCMGPGIGAQASLFANALVSLKAVTAAGKLMQIDASQQNLLSAFRLSYGLLGIIVEVKLRVRPIATFSARHRRMDVDTFATVCSRVAGGDVGLRFTLLPYLDQAHVDLRHYQADAGDTWNAPWKIKDWGESTVLPAVFKSLHRVVPLSGVRYQLIDRISSATHGLVNGRMLATGNNASASGTWRRTRSPRLQQSTWCFPATDFALIVKAYARFCRESFARSAYRCDLPASGFRIARDRSALLSPSFDEAMIVLQTRSTQQKGWDDFVLDLADFAENWAGTPLFNQTQAIRDLYVPQAYPERIAFFRRIRAQLDPENRLLNPYLGRFFA